MPLLCHARDFRQRFFAKSHMHFDGRRLIAGGLEGADEIVASL
jgi:hypothetical protein